MTFWTALIAAGGAFLGVLVAQAWTSSREKRQWEQARERDRDLWDREDRHRFAEHKRDLYAEFLAQADRWHRAMQDIRLVYGSDGQPPSNTWEQWIPTTGTSARQQVDLLLNRIRLVSQSAWKEASAYVDQMDQLTKFVYCAQPFPASLDESVIVKRLDNLTDSFRADLGAR